MARKHAGGIITPTGFRIENPSPIDDRLVVETIGDLTSSAALPNIYGGILVAVSESNYDLFKWNGNDRTSLDNWSAFSGSAIGSSGGDADSSLSSLSAISASFASNSISSSFSATSSFAFSSDFATTSSHALSSISSSFSTTASHLINFDLNALASSSFDGNRDISAAHFPEIFGRNPYENAYGYFNEDSSSIQDFLEAVFYPPVPNLPPQITSNNQISVLEFLPSGSSVHFITATDQLILNDPDTGDPITVFRTQSTYTDDFFRIDNPAVGEITLNTLATSSMNSPGGQHLLGDSHQFYYEVGDSRGAFTKDTLYIRIIPDNKPEFTTPSGIVGTINEFDHEGIFIAKIEGTDVENGVTFRTSSDNTDGFFNIDSNTGNITAAVKPLRSMNTDPITGAYPLDIEIVDQYDTPTNPFFNKRTFFIKVKPNTAPIYRLNDSTGTIIDENSFGLGLYSLTSGPGEKITIYSTNNTNEFPIETDNIIIETGSLSSEFTNDFSITINNSDLVYSELGTPTPFLKINQTAESLNPALQSSYQLVITASDQHYQSGEDPDSISYLTINLTVTANADPQLTEATQSFSINENSDNLQLVTGNQGNLAAFDPDASPTLTEQPFIANMQLKGAFFRDGGFPPLSDFPAPVDTSLHSNITESLGGTSLLNPSANPFEKGNNLEIRRKSNVFLNSDIANLYEYQVSIGGDFTPADADIGIIQIRILDHEPDSTFTTNWVGNPSILESALKDDFLRTDPNGFSGDIAEISFTSGIPHNYEISSSNDFIKINGLGNTATLQLDKNISKSAFIREDIIDLEITASQTNFPTTKQFRKYAVNISPNNGPTLGLNLSNYSNFHTTNGALAGQNTLGAIEYSDPDAEGDHINPDSFIFNGNSLLTAVLDEIPGNNRFLIKSTVNLDIGTYTFDASLKDTHGFATSTIQGSITISEALSALFISNNSVTHLQETTGIFKPKFFIIDTATEGTIVIKENHGQPVIGTQANLSITYTDPLESETNSFTAFVAGNSNIFSINNTTGEISAGPNFAAQSYTAGDIIEVTVEFISDISQIRTEIIFIEITENIAPTADVELENNLQSVLSSNSLLFTIKPSNLQTQFNEGDSIITPTVNITGIDNTVEKVGNNYEVRNNVNITTDNPEGNDYTTTLSSNVPTFVFYILEKSDPGDNVIIETNGVSSTGTAATVNVNYVSTYVQTYNYSFNLSDSAGKFNSFSGNVSITPPTANFISYTIAVDGITDKFSITHDSDGNGTIVVGSGFNYEFGEGPLTAVITATDNYGNSKTQNATINITENHSPTLNVSSINEANLVSPVSINTTLFTIPAGTLNDTEQDPLTITHPTQIGGSDISILGTQPINHPYNSSAFVFQNDAVIFNNSPLSNEYTHTMGNNQETNTRFYIQEKAIEDDFVRTSDDGFGGNEATITPSYGLPSADTYGYNIVIKDNENLSTTIADSIDIAHTQSLADSFSIVAKIGGTTTVNNLLKITKVEENGIFVGKISAGSAFANQNLSDNDLITADITVINTYGHTDVIEGIIIEVTPNRPPSFTLQEESLYQQPIPVGSTLLTIQNINEPEGDSIGDVNVTISLNGLNISPPNISTISGYNDIVISNSFIINEVGTYTYSVSLEDQHGNASAVQTGTFEVIQAAPTVRFYKANIPDTPFDNFEDAMIGLSDGSSLLPPAGVIAGSIYDIFQDDNLEFPTVPTTVVAGGFGNKVLTFLGSANLDVLSDVSPDFGNGNGISSFGPVNLVTDNSSGITGEKFIIVYPTNIISGANAVVDGLPGSDQDDTYYLFAKNPNLNGGQSVMPSNLLSFTKNNVDFKMIYLQNADGKNGDFHFYLFPDERTSNLDEILDL